MTRGEPCLLLCILIGACAKQVPSPSAPPPVARSTAAPTTVAPPEQVLAMPVSPCASIGPFGCDLPPSSQADLCAQLGECIRARDPGKAGLLVDGCGELSAFEAAPDGSGRIAVVNLDGRVDGVSGQGSYLVAEREGGYCVVDQAVQWTSTRDGYLDTDSRIAWRRDGDRTLLALRMQAMDFDEGAEEEGSGVVRDALCRDAEYALVEGRFVTVSERSLREPCADEE